jgi:alpha-tubulin suppressor-like RCC1 family protein
MWKRMVARYLRNAGKCRHTLPMVTFALLLGSVGSPGRQPAIATRAQTSFAIDISGRLLGWGEDNANQLGQGRALQFSTPQSLGGGYAGTSADSGLHIIAAGDEYTITVKSDGTLWTWGKNDYGQLGDGSNASRASPRQVGTGFRTVAAGASHTVAVGIDGSLWAWGYNLFGQLGDGTDDQDMLVNQRYREIYIAQPAPTQ